jgi:aminocarboxymuconate-semialdehyde decarboxylase
LSEPASDEDSSTPALDVHAHYFSPEYIAAARACLNDAGVPPDATGFLTSYERLDTDPTFTGAIDERLELMDAAAIAVQVLSFSAGNVWHPNPDVRTRLVEQFNDGCAEVVQRHPERFRLLANMPLPFVDCAIRETERALTLPGCVGVSTCTHSGGIPIDDRRWDPLYEMWSDLGLVVFVHPDGFCAPEVLGGHFMGWALGAPFDDTIAAVQLMVSGTLERFPGIQWVVPHCGGALPFLLERVDRVWGSYRHLLPEAERPRRSVERLIFDTASPSAAAIALTAEVLTSERLVFGTDFPFANRNDLTEPRRMLHEAGLASGKVDPVLAGAAAPSLRMGPRRSRPRRPRRRSR